MRLLLGIASVLAATLVLNGCGGTSGSFLATALGISIVWPSLSGRAVDAPDAALSGVFTIHEGSAGGHDISLTFNRDVGDSGGTRRYRFPSEVKVGRWDYVVNFYSDLGGQGSIVATASGEITVYPDSTSSLDKTTIIPAGTIASVTIAPNQSILVGQTKAIAFTALDQLGHVVALPPKAAVFTVISGGTFLSVAGSQGTGLAPGVAAVTVIVNQGSANPVTSPQENITVTGILNSVTLNPTSVPGGSTSTGTVTLNAPAGTTGQVVQLSTSVPAAASVPGSVTVPSGSTTAQFTVSTSPVAADTAATITATADGLSSTATLTVLAPGLASVTLNPTSVTGGTSSEGTVTLTGPAAGRGATVDLSSSDPNVATVPTTVLVPPGSTSATFTVGTIPVTADSQVTITATASGVSKTATLAVQAPVLVSLTLNPSTAPYGGSVEGVVTLSGNVAAGTSATVDLTRSVNAEVAMGLPTSVTVPAGASSMKFTVSSVFNRGSVAQVVTITATYAGVSKSADLTALPANIG